MVSSQQDTAQLQRTPRPVGLDRLDGLDLHFQYYTARQGGDFFDAIHVASWLLFLLSDIAGRRQETHPIAAETQDAFRRCAVDLFNAPNVDIEKAIADLAEVLNHTLIGAADGVHFAPTFLGCYDTRRSVLAYVNAGGQVAAFRDSQGTHTLPGVAMPMGLFTNQTYAPSFQAFEPGAKLLVVTKGVTECSCGKEEFGSKRLLRLLQETTSDSAEEICYATLTRALGMEKLRKPAVPSASWGQETCEDLTAFALVRLPQSSAPDPGQTSATRHQS